MNCALHIGLMMCDNIYLKGFFLYCSSCLDLHSMSNWFVGHPQRTPDMEHFEDGIQM